MPPPPPEVLAAFGAAGPPVALAGGQRTVWRVGDVVLKPQDSPEYTIAWQAQVLYGLVAAVRTAPPLPAHDGRWVVDGWTAWRYAPGVRRPAAWAEIAAAGRELHRALAGVPAPEWLAARDDPWSRAARLAWSDDDAAPAAPWVTELVAARRPLDPGTYPAQLVHTDLTGNVLFADGRAPLVLDLSLREHPPAFAGAIVAADAMLWEGAGPKVVDRIAAAETAPARAEFGQFLLRAVLFRLFAARLARPDLDEGALRTEFTDVARETLRRCA